MGSGMVLRTSKMRMAPEGSASERDLARESARAETSGMEKRLLRGLSEKRIIFRASTIVITEPDFTASLRAV
jgi:hypothetical protein